MRQQHCPIEADGLYTRDGSGARNIDGRNQGRRGALPTLDLPSLTGRWGWEPVYTTQHVSALKMYPQTLILSGSKQWRLIRPEIDAEQPAA